MGINQDLTLVEQYSHRRKQVIIFRLCNIQNPLELGKEMKKRSYSRGVKFKGEVDLGFALKDWQPSAEDLRISKYRVGQKVHSGFSIIWQI